MECCDKLEPDDIYIRVNFSNYYLSASIIIIDVLLYGKQYVEISYASEPNKDGEKDDPVKETYFWTKNEPWKAIKGDDDVCMILTELWMLCLPCAYYVRCRKRLKNLTLYAQ